MFIENKLFKKIPVNGAELYLISESGDIYSIKYKKVISTWVHKTAGGYPSELCQLSLPTGRKHFKVHRLVTLSWIGEPPSELHTDVNHIDGDSLNNHFSNLEWCTKSQNQRHAIETGLKGKGSELYNATLSETQVHEICNKLKEGCRPIDLSKEYNTSVDIIRKIRAGDTYFHIRCLYDISHEYTQEYSYSTVEWVCQRIVEGVGDTGIVKSSTNTNLTVIDVKRIRYKIRYKHISDKYF